MENEKARKMVDWFEGREVQHWAPLRLESYLTITDVDQYVFQSVATLRAMEAKLKRGIGVRVFKLAYFRLFHLKQYIERNEQIKTT